MKPVGCNSTINHSFSTEASLLVKKHAHWWFGARKQLNQTKEANVF